MSEPHDAPAGDIHLADAFAVHESAVGASSVLQQPRAAAFLDNGVLPRDARIGQHDVSLRVSADAIGGPGCQQPVRTIALNTQPLN